MMESAHQNSEYIRERFSRISIVKGFLSILLLGILAFIALFIIEVWLEPDDISFELMIMYTSYGIPLFLFFWALYVEKLQYTAIFKGRVENLRKVAYVIPMLAISIGTMWLIIIALYFINTGWAESYLVWLNSIELFDIGPETSALQYLLIFTAVAVLAPIVEEIIFRGILIERLGRKYSYTSGLIISSIIFGILHVSFISAAIFGIVLGLIYLKTRSLMLPVLIHVANNSIAMIIVFLERPLGIESWETVEPYISNGLIGAMIFGAGIAWLIWFLKNNWSYLYDLEPFRDDIIQEVQTDESSRETNLVD